MDVKRLRQMQRESSGISAEDVKPRAATTTIVSPAVTRRPGLDAQLADISVISGCLLEQMRCKVLSGDVLDKDELRQFRELAETSLRQARVEIEVEKHVTARTSALSADQIRHTIIDALKTKGLGEDVADVVLEALGMAA